MKKVKIFEGESKKIYESENDSELIQEFKDEAPTIDGSKGGKIKHKGVINNQISSHLFKFLSSYNIPTYFVQQAQNREMVIKKLDMIPIKVVIHNVAAGDMVTKYGVKEGKELECPIIEYYLKDVERQDPMINEDHIVSFGHATSEELREIHRLSSKINAILKDFFRRRYLNLVNFKIEFGRSAGKVFLADEICPDTCRFIDLKSNDNLDLKLINQDLEKAEAIYTEIKDRILVGK